MIAYGPRPGVDDALATTDGLHRVVLVCGHVRRVEQSLAGMVTAGHIPALHCHTCGALVTAARPTTEETP